MRNLHFIALAILIFLVGCKEREAVSLSSTKWQVERLNGSEVPKDEDDSFTIQFGDDNTIGAKGACNRVMGGYTPSEDGSLSFGNLASTMMYCPNIEREDEYMKALEGVTRYRVKGSTLTLYNDDEAVVILKLVE